MDNKSKVIPKYVKSSTSKTNDINSKPILDSAKIANVLPDHLYKIVAPIVGLDVDIKEKLAQEKRKDIKKLLKGVRHLSKALRPTTAEKEEETYTGDTYVEPPTPRLTTPKINPYYDFLQKPVREQVRWESKYLAPETDKEKGLVKRADEITEQICADFAKYLDDLGGYDSHLFRKENIKKLFQIEFNTHATKSLHIEPLIMRCIPKELAQYSEKPEISYENTITNNIKWDIKAENIPSRKLAFNRKIPKDLYYHTPKINVKQIWKPQNYPKDLVTLEAVWDDILSSKSVQDYCDWMIMNPKVSRPRYLRKNQMFDVKNLKKICHQHKYNKENNLPPIDVKKLINREEKRDSPLPENLKIIL